MSKSAEAELAELKALIKTVALTLYRHGTWQQLPWGPKQILSGFIQPEIDAWEPRSSLTPPLEP